MSIIIWILYLPYFPPKTKICMAVAHRHRDRPVLVPAQLPAPAAPPTPLVRMDSVDGCSAAPRRRRASSELAHLTAVKLTSGASSSGGGSAGAGAGVSKGAGVGVCKDGRESARARKGFLAFSFCALSCACHSRCRA